MCFGGLRSASVHLAAVTRHAYSAGIGRDELLGASTFRLVGALKHNRKIASIIYNPKN